MSFILEGGGGGGDKLKTEAELETGATWGPGASET